MAYHNQGLQGPLDSSMEKLIMTETSCKCRKACGRKESKDGCKIEMELKLVCEYMKVRGSIRKRIIRDSRVLIKEKKEHILRNK